MNIGYLFKRIKNMSFSQIPAFVKRSKESSGKCTAAVYADMLVCALKYGAGYIDYTIFGMHSMNAKERKQLITREKNNNYVRYLNPKEHRIEFSDKVQFLKQYGEFIGRDWLYLADSDENQLAAFCSAHPEFMAKTIDGMCGKGVEKIKFDGDVHALKERLTASNQLLLEELIRQHDDVSAIYPNAINTVRVCTIKGDDGKVHIVFSCMRFGRGESSVDNFNSGGMSAVVDLQTGKLTGSAIDKSGHLFAAHPDTKSVFDGFAIPYWNEIKATVTAAAQKSGFIRYIGWDIAVTPHGPVIVEGNEFPGHDLYQLFGQNPEKKGMLTVFNKIVPYSEVKAAMKK